MKFDDVIAHVDDNHISDQSQIIAFNNAANSQSSVLFECFVFIIVYGINQITIDQLFDLYVYHILILSLSLVSVLIQQKYRHLVLLITS